MRHTEGVVQRASEYRDGAVTPKKENQTVIELEMDAYESKLRCGMRYETDNHRTAPIETSLSNWIGWILIRKY